MQISLKINFISSHELENSVGFMKNPFFSDFLPRGRVLGF